MEQKTSLLNRLREKLKTMLSMDYPPSVMAKAAAIGVIVAFSPYLGLHTYMVLTISSVFKMPLYPLLVGAYVNNPITLVPIYAFALKAGMWILGTKLTTSIDFANFHFQDLLDAGKTIILPFFIGCHLVGLVIGIFTYFIVYYIIKKYRQSGLV